MSPLDYAIVGAWFVRDAARLFQGLASRFLSLPALWFGMCVGCAEPESGPDTPPPPSSIEEKLAGFRHLRLEPRHCTELPPLTVQAGYAHLKGDEDVNDEPIVITDLAPRSDGSLVVLDASIGRVTVLDPSLRPVHTSGRSGGGPGEFREPVAVAAYGHESIYILDGSGTVTEFTVSGEYVRSMRLRLGDHVGRPRFSDLAVTSSGDLLVAIDPSVSMALQAREPLPYVVRITSDWATIDTLLTYDMAALDERPLLTPIATKVRLTASSAGSFAVWYEFDRSFVVYHPGQPPLHISGCMDPSIEAGYRRQRKEAFGQYESTVRAVQGVWFDEQDLYVASTDWQNGLGRITHFNSAGAPVGTYDFALGDGRSHVHYYMSLSGSSGGILAWGRPNSGHLDRWTVALPGS